MEEKDIFNDKYIHFKWDDSLEGKKGFFSDSACNFKDYIYNPTTKERFYAEEIITKSLDNEEYPFEDPDGGKWKFVYYDPNYEAKIAWTNGNTIQYKDNDGVWHDLLSSKPEWGAIEYRVKPDKYKVLMINGRPLIMDFDTRTVSTPMFEGSYKECKDYAHDKFCKNCCTHSGDFFFFFLVCSGYTGPEYTEQKQYRPFKDIDELLSYWRNTHSLIADQFFVDCEPSIWVKFKNLNYKVMIDGFYEESNRIHISSLLSSYTLQELYNEFSFINGKPCGIEVNE